MSNVVSSGLNDNLAESDNEDLLENKQDNKQEIEPKNLRLNITPYFLGLFLFFCAVTSLLTVFLYQQQQYFKLIEEQHKLISGKLLQTTYLFKANKLIESLTKSDNTVDYASLQTQLSEINKQLSMMSSTSQSKFHQWQLKDNSKNSLAERISRNNIKNQEIKSSFLEQLSILFDQTNKQQDSAVASANLVKLEKQLEHILSIVEVLNLHTSLSEFERLRLEIDNLFSSALFLKVDVKQSNNANLSTFELRLLTLKELVMVEGFLAKWQGHLRLIGEYHQQLFDLQKQVREVLDSSTDENIEQAKVTKPLKLSIFESIIKFPAQQVQLRLSLGLALVCILFACLLWYVREYVKRFVLKNDELLESLQNFQLDPALMKDREKELAQLVEQCHQQHEKLVAAEENEQQQILAMKLLKSTTHTAEEFEFISQQICGEELTDIIHVQLTTLALLSVEQKSMNECLQQFYKQNRRIAERLKQMKLYSYLRTEKATLSLSDVDLVAEMQAILLNQSTEISSRNNQISLVIHKNIQTQVNLDAQIFAELIRIFSQLLLAEQSETSLKITLALQDKNDGQQNISFTGIVQAVYQDKSLARTMSEKLKLPEVLQFVHEGNSQTAQNELLKYFYLLLERHYGEHLSVSLTERGYQLSFVMPFAVLSKRDQTTSSSILEVNDLPLNKAELRALAKQYQLQPIELLLAVRKPQEQQHLIQLLQAFGLQITVAANIVTQQQQWQSGRFTVLITEFESSPFIDFVNDLAGNCRLQRGVFALGHEFTMPNAEKFSTWVLAVLPKSTSSTIYIKQLATLLSPWLKNELIDPTTDRKDKAHKKSGQENDLSFMLQTIAPKGDDQLAFDFDLYLLNQGSAELALYMLADYIDENSVLITKLTETLEQEDFSQASDVVSSLLLNAKILAATELIQFCYHWQTLLSERNMSTKSSKLKRSSENPKYNVFALQAKLLSKTKHEIVAIARYAQTL
mgnify:CR=1 FL=1